MTMSAYVFTHEGDVHLEVMDDELEAPELNLVLASTGLRDLIEIGDPTKPHIKAAEVAVNLGQLVTVIEACDQASGVCDMVRLVPDPIPADTEEAVDHSMEDLRVFDGSLI